MHPPTCILTETNKSPNIFVTLWRAYKHNTMIAIMYLFNLIFFITGIALVSSGSVLSLKFKEWVTFVRNSAQSVEVFVVMIGILMICVSILGFVALNREAPCMVVIYVLLMAGLFILQLMSAIMGYAVRQNIHDSLEVEMINSINNFNPVNESAWPITKMQEKLQCCEIIQAPSSSAKRYTEWQNPNTTFYKWAQTEEQLFGNIKSCACDPSEISCYCVHVPFSCCKDPDNISCGINVDSESFSEKLWSDNCWQKLKILVLNQLVIVAGAAVLICMLEVIAMIFGFRYWKRINAKSYENMDVRVPI